MADFVESSQHVLWTFESADLVACRDESNRRARHLLYERQRTADDAADRPPNLLVDSFACGYRQRRKVGEPLPETVPVGSSGSPWQTDKGHPYLTPDEESTLVSFYAGKLPYLIGPKATVPRLRRDSKVYATAHLYLRRFFLSNSVMLHDPKLIMVAAAWLATKTEDVTADGKLLEQGTNELQAPIPINELLPAELALLQGIHFDLLCFHGLKPLLALTEDLRVFLKSSVGTPLVERLLSGQDLKPIYEAAKKHMEHILLSDLPLLYTPGQLALASLMVAQQDVQDKMETDNTTPRPPRMDLEGYVLHRFEEQNSEHAHLERLRTLCGHIRSLTDENSDANFGSGLVVQDMTALKAIHKKLKKVRTWGNTGSDTKDKKSKNKRKREDKSDDEGSKKGKTGNE